jgi:hypothetical protein
MKHLTSAERVLYRLSCPNCGKVTERTVAHLAGKAKVSCAKPGCRKGIDIQALHHQEVLGMLVNCCARLDDLALKRDRLS